MYAALEFAFFLLLASSNILAAPLANPALMLASTPCTQVHLTSSRLRPTIWNVVTERSYQELLHDISDANKILVHDNRPEMTIRLRQILSGEKALLVLGEGRSNLVGHLIDRYLHFHPELTMAPHIHAVDQVYLNELMNDSRYLSKYPFNYHGQYFQNFRVEDGRRFDEIWAPHSLGYLMTNISVHETDATFAHILQQMNPSGVLRIWPAFRDMETRVLVRNLQQRGLIARYAWADLILNLQTPAENQVAGPPP